MPILPIIKIGKKRYYVDKKLKQLRNVENHHDCIVLKNWSIMGLKYLKRR